MHLDIHETPAITAANDNDPTWTDYETESCNIDLSGYVLKLTPEVSAYLGLDATEMPFAYFDYLLDGDVADDDELASQRLIELMDVWAGPGWR